MTKAEKREVLVKACDKAYEASHEAYKANTFFRLPLKAYAEAYDALREFDKEK